jgi:hypothetical protein
MMGEGGEGGYTVHYPGTGHTATDTEGRIE